MSSASPTMSSSPALGTTMKEGLDKPHQHHHPTSEYHDTQHRLEYVTVHGGSPCVLPTMHSTFQMDKADNTLARPGVQG
jgi:hypothetical protein